MKLTKDDLEDAYNLIEAHLQYFENEYGYQKDDENLSKFKDLIKEHFKGIENLDEMIEIQKNNLTSNYMIGLFNGLILAKGIIENVDVDKLMIECKEDNPPLKLEELERNMWVWDNFLEEYVMISDIIEVDGNYYFIFYDYRDAMGYDEKRFYKQEVRK